jgi:hypothetical protein
MSSPSEWVPMLWPSGPLDTALNPQTKAVSDAWHRPESLAIIKNTAVNCIVVTWAAGKPEDAEQQRSLQPLIAKAREMGVAVVGRCFGPAPKESAGVDALLATGPAESKTIIPVSPASRVTSSPAAIVAVEKTLWPKIATRETNKAEADASAGPTGSPWVNSNGWMISLVQAKAPGKAVWTLAEPPKDAAQLRPEMYALAIADAEAYGASWLIALDAKLRSGLTSNSPESLSDWKIIGESVRFFAQRRGWRSYTPAARLGVMSDFTGANEYLAGEVLNLCNRRHLPYRVLDQAHVSADSFQELRAVLLVNSKPPEGKLRQQVEEFVRSGGLLIVPASATPLVAGIAQAGNFDNRYDYFPVGRGKIAIAKKPWTDPYVIATDTHLVLSRRNDAVRLWNAGVTNVRYTVSRKGTGLLQLINYATRQFGHPMSAYVDDKYKSARITSLPGGESSSLEVLPKGNGIEIAIPPFSVFAAIELGA